MSNVSPLATPHLRTVTSVIPAPGTAPDPHAGGLLRLPEGAVVTPWPQTALAALAAALPGIEGITGADTPMVGYLVLVPAESASVAARTAAVAPVTQLRSVQRSVAPDPDAQPAAQPDADPDREPFAAEAAVAADATAPAATTPAQPVPAQGLHLDADRRVAHIDGEPLELTYLEFELLTHLTANPHRVHTRDHLVTVVWGYGHIGDGRTVDVHIARLRRKLGADYRRRIVTVRRVGYKYLPPKQG
ncbi:winged helix-turn-helix domain-containing protein [Streptacidiphilus carbonis]|uniref:winged helix-turn-helix domain-containing protein n=1 Tax=Streptacidiphilus carbonis TaxID=105422 RepID=UPI0005A96CDC|nr:winged helix-turn-helix domain-containing protein [Streptacidiphilus carbonis]